MIYFVTLGILLVLTVPIEADGALGGLVYAPRHASADYYAYPNYAFNYAVRDASTGDNKAQWEKRDGDVVRGAYSLVEPGGSIRIVEYWADSKSGFNAVIKRIGPKVHPPTIRSAPIYKAPIPVLSSAAVAAPITVGSVAKFGGLASAPLLSGSVLGGGLSTGSLLSAAAPLPIAKTLAPVAPILSTPILPAPIVKTAPLLSASLAASLVPAAPIISSAPILSAPLSLARAPLGLSTLGFGAGLFKAPLAAPVPVPFDGLGHLAKGSLLPAWGSILDSPLLGLKN